MAKLLIMLVLLVAAGVLVWDVAGAFLGDTKTEREVRTCVRPRHTWFRRLDAGSG